MANEKELVDKVVDLALLPNSCLSWAVDEVLKGKDLAVKRRLKPILRSKAEKKISEKKLESKKATVVTKQMLHDAKRHELVCPPDTH